MPVTLTPSALIARRIPAGWQACVGAQLKDRRRAKHVTIENLAAVIGCSKNHVVKLERGEASLQAIVYACAALGVDPSTVIRDAWAVARKVQR